MAEQRQENNKPTKRTIEIWARRSLPGTITVLPSSSLKNCGSLDLFSRILVWFCGFYPNIFSKEKEKGKRRDLREKTMQGITRPSHFTKTVGHTGSGTTVLPDKIVLRSHARPKDDVRVDHWWQERASYAGRYSRYRCFIVHRFAGKTVVCGCSKIHHWPTASDVDRFARFSWDLAFTWRGNVT